MNHSLTFSALTLVGASLVSAAPEDFRIEKDPSTPTQPLKLKFWGNPNVYYVIESSLDLRESWDEYFYAVKGVAGIGGTGQFEAVQFAPFPQTDKAFFRLRFDSNPFSLLGMADHDGDGIPTALELDAGMDAMLAETIVDSDGDGLPDYWEQFYFGDLSRDGTLDFDDDGTLDGDEWAARSHPTDSGWDIPYWNDQDADLFSAFTESLLGTNLSSANADGTAAVTETVDASSTADVILTVGDILLEVNESNTESLLSEQ